MAILEINLGKIKQNASNIIEAMNGLDVVGVVKACSGDKRVAQAFVEAGIRTIADSQVEGLRCMKSLPVKKMLLRLPFDEKVERGPDLNGIDQVLVSSNQDLARVKDSVGSKNIDILLMVESGLKREGFLPSELGAIEKLISKNKSLGLTGVATNTACQNGTNPVNQLQGFVKNIPEINGVEIISGGNSSVLPWAVKGELPQKINQLRIGEAILLGHDTSKYEKIVSNHLDAFKLRVPVVETGRKGSTRQALLGIGIREIGAGRLRLVEKGLGKIEKLYSEHTTLRLSSKAVVGKSVWFIPDYYCLVALMLSPYVKKRYTY